MSNISRTEIMNFYSNDSGSEGPRNDEEEALPSPMANFFIQIFPGWVHANN